MATPYSEHRAEVIVNATPHQVYSMFSHFNDFPKFMSFIEEVTYKNDQNSHWVADIAGKQEWDAVNENWQPDRKIGWHSVNGLDNFGHVTFTPASSHQTVVDVYIAYNPPAGILGDAVNKLGVGEHFDTVLQNDLNHFARMVEKAPAGSLDPNNSNYLFHAESAAAKGKTTSRQDDTMRPADPVKPADEQRTQRPILDRDIIGDTGNVGSNPTMPSGPHRGNPTLPGNDDNPYNY